MTEPTTVWPDDEFAKQARKIAGSLTHLILQPRRWIHRRVESVEFLDIYRLRRRTSVDFTIPKRRFVPIEIGGRQVSFLPLALLAKRILKDFDLCDESGAALPLLTQAQNSAVAFAILQLQAEILLKTEVDPEVLADLHGLVASEAVATTKALRNFEGPQGPGSHDQRQRLWASSRFQTLARDLSGQFLMIVPLEDEAGARRVIKFSYEEPYRSQRWSLGQFLGLQPVPFAVLAPAIGLTESYHAEIAAPDDLMISRAELLELREGQQPFSLSKDIRTLRADLYAKDLTRGTLGAITLELRIRRAGVFLAALAIGVVTTGILWTGWILHKMNIGVSRDVAAVLLVALPGVFATYLARPDEHRLVKRFIGGLRVLILGLAMLSYAAAASLAVLFQASTRAWVWLGCALGATAITAVIATALGLSALRDWRTRG